MRRASFIGVIGLLLALAAGVETLAAQENREAAVDLAGRWRFALDSSDAGEAGQWASRKLGESIHLPGILQGQGFGDEVGTNTPWVLSLYDRHWFLREDYKDYAQPGKAKVPFLCQPPRHYLGAAWFQRDIKVPERWRGRRVVLFLERPHWQSVVWVDGQRIGDNDSLVAPHEYDLGFLASGAHVLTIRVDNRLLLPYRPDAHSVSDSLAGSWNGIVGRIELQATSPVWVEEVQVFPHSGATNLSLRIKLGNQTGQSGRGVLSVQGDCCAGAIRQDVNWETNGATFDVEVPLKSSAQLWDEFHPALQRLTMGLEGAGADDTREVVFGLREFRARGQELVVNGRPIHLRGTHHGGDFPLTGYPATDVAYWHGIFKICQEWGLNHVRFHSFCPPDAAFTAADELGIYVQVECGMWNDFSPGSRMESMLYKETRRILHAYGNHPSLMMISPSNEPKGRWRQVLPQWVEAFRREDSRHLYAPATGNCPIEAPGQVEGADYLDVARIGTNRVRGESGWFGRDYSNSVAGVTVPVVVHELGQWCAYPDYDVMAKFRGYMCPGNYEIFRRSADAHGLLERNRELAKASGRFQLLCYKEEIEANLRTPGLAGFQLLDLHDYVGQGTALVGLLDPFWESKGYVQPGQFLRFCSETVPLARLRRRVFTTLAPFDAEVMLAHYGAADLTNARVSWKLVNGAGHAFSSGGWNLKSVRTGATTYVGTIATGLSNVIAPQACRLVVRVESAGRVFENDWSFWVYPASQDDVGSGQVVVTTDWDQAQGRLEKGGRVLFVPEPSHLDWSCPPLESTPVFWNRLLFPGWGRMLGLWCAAGHPALKGFPSEWYCDWQWIEVMRGRRAVNLDRLPAALQPIVQPIDDWNRNYKLGLIFECRVGAGKLMVCSADIFRDLERHPVARQLRRSLLSYMESKQFEPAVSVPAGVLRALWFDTQAQQRLGARAEAEGENVRAVLDGDPGTYWRAGAKGSHYPYELTINYPKPVTFSGVVFMNRQNDREHAGDIRQYRLLAAEGPDSPWREIVSGELVSTWNPQTVRLPGRVTAQRLKLVALSGFGSDTSVALAEFAILYEAESRK